MFSNLRFIFPQESIQLSAQKITVLANIIQNNGGTVVQTDKYNEDAYIIIAIINQSQAVKLCQRLRASFDTDKFLKPEFISKCVAKGKIINMIPYRHFQQQFEQEEPIFDPHKSYYLEEKIKQKKEKMLHLLNNQMQYELIYDYDPIVKKEEDKSYQGVPFYGDDDCQIVESHLFDGLDVKKDNKFQKHIKIQQQEGVREKMHWEPKGQKFVCTEGSALIQLQDSYVSLKLIWIEWIIQNIYVQHFKNAFIFFCSHSEFKKQIIYCIYLNSNLQVCQDT